MAAKALAVEYETPEKVVHEMYESLVGKDAIKVDVKVRKTKRYVPPTMALSPEFVRKMIGVFTKAAHRALRNYLKKKGITVTRRLRGYRDAINALTGMIAKDFYADLYDKIQEALASADGTAPLIEKGEELAEEALKAVGKKV